MRVQVPPRVRDLGIETMQMQQEKCSLSLSYFMYMQM